MKKAPERKHLLNFDHNIGFNKKYTTIALYAVLILCFGAVCVYFLINNDKYASAFATISGIITPIFIGMVLAYILNPFLKLFEQQIFISSAQRKLNKARRQLFKDKLSYDHLRNKPEISDKMLESARQTLADTRLTLAAAYQAVKEEQTKRNEKLQAKAAKKNKKPSYIPLPVKDRSHPARGISLLCTYLIFLAIVTLILWIVIPQCIESVTSLIIKIGDLVKTLPAQMDKLLTTNEIAGNIYSYISEYVSKDVDIKAKLMEMVTSLVSGLTSYLSRLLTALPNYVSSAFSGIKNIVLAVFFSVYFLLSKEMLSRQAHKLGKAFLPSKFYKGSCHVIYEIDRKFGKFIEGKILDSTIIGILALIILWIFQIPYYQMIALIIGVTNIIPFFGPFIGAIPSAVIVLISDPPKVIPFILIILILQQIDGNIIGPWILGDSLGLQPIWIMIAIVIMSGLFGFFGMLFGVPLFAVIYTLVREAADKRIKAAKLKKTAAEQPASLDNEPK